MNVSVWQNFTNAIHFYKRCEVIFVCLIEKWDNCQCGNAVAVYKMYSENKNKIFHNGTVHQFKSEGTLITISLHNYITTSLHNSIQQGFVDQEGPVHTGTRLYQTAIINSVMRTWGVRAHGYSFTLRSWCHQRCSQMYN